VGRGRRDGPVATDAWHEPTRRERPACGHARALIR
jgi:hypothetical protein